MKRRRLDFSQWPQAGRLVSSRLNPVARTPNAVATNKAISLFCAVLIPQINIGAMTYFAASTFWRASIYRWNTDGTFPVKLGPFEEDFRQYLLGHASVPQAAALTVVVREGALSNKITYEATGTRYGNVHVFRYPFPGLAFLLTVSRNLPESNREYCFVRGLGNTIMMSAGLEEFVIWEAKRDD